MLNEKGLKIGVDNFSIAAFGLIEKRFVLTEDSVKSLKKTCSLAPFPIIKIFTL